MIIIGLLFVAAGLLWPLSQKLSLGRLPGDIMIKREGVRLYLPITTSLLVSFVLSLLFWFFKK